MFMKEGGIKLNGVELQKYNKNPFQLYYFILK